MLRHNMIWLEEVQGWQLEQQNQIPYQSIKVCHSISSIPMIIATN